MKKTFLILLSSTFIQYHSIARTTNDLVIEFISPDSKGSLAGQYVASFAGANTASYTITFKNGSYSGVYEEHMDGGHKKVVLTNIKVDETTNSISFIQEKDSLTGKLTTDGLIIDEVTYSKI